MSIRTTTTLPVQRIRLPDGKYQVWIVGAAPATHTLDVDLVQFLGGEAARRAYMVENPHEPEGHPTTTT
jgi:hypothetical protein